LQGHEQRWQTWLCSYLSILYQGLNFQPLANPKWLGSNTRKKDWIIFDASFLIHALSCLYNSCVSNEFKPKILFGGTWHQYLQCIYTLHISFPDEEILTFDDDVVSAFQQIK
jgi:hypothetical protein